MNESVQLAPGAIRDIEEIAAWYGDKREGLDQRFLDEIDDLLQRMASFPRQFPMIDETHRRGLLRRFPYGVFFRLKKSDVAVVIAVLHMHRRPGSWIRHLP